MFIIPSIHPSVPPGPLRPEICPLRPEICPLRSEISPLRPSQAFCLPFQPERADFRPESLDFRPERTDFRPERAWGRQTDRQTNGRTKVPLCSTGHCSLWGSCPASHHSNSQSGKAGQLVSLTTYCPWATCSGPERADIRSEWAEFLAWEA